MIVPAKLVVIQGPQRGLSFAADRMEVSIGRESSNDIELKDLSVSRRHCLLRFNGSSFVLSSLESTNGTRVNGVPIQERVLGDGDDIMVGDTVLRFVMSEGEISPLTLDSSALSLEGTTRLPLEQTAAKEPPATREVNGLLQLSKQLSAVGSVEDAYRLFVDAALYFTSAKRCALVHPASGSETGWGCYAARNASGWLSQCFPVSSTVLNEVAQSRSALLIEEVQRSNMLSASLSSAGVRSVIALPMHVAGKLYGVLYLDSLESPLTLQHLQWVASAGGMVNVALEQLIHRRSLAKENQQLKAENQLRHALVGESPAMRQVYQRIAKIALSEATVLILGESGTGKELAARAIHENGSRRPNPFVTVNCALLNENLMESDLFGHEKGAFTGAVQQKKGKIELADGGTLFLDELWELSLLVQAKLLRVIQERQFDRLGGTRPISVDVRILGATHRDLEKAVAAKNFRHDLYFRLKVVTLEMPPLRDRREDIPALARYLLERCAQRSRRRIYSIDPDAMRLLKAYNWPGNVRELENVVEYALVMGEDSVLRAQDLPEVLFEAQVPSEETGPRFYNQLNMAKQKIIREALEAADWNYTQAAAHLGINRTYLHRVARSLRIAPKGPLAE